MTAKDIPGRNVVSLIVDDQPCLADGMVNHPEEPILLLAHPDRHALPAAVAAVKICYKPAPSIHSIEESERREVIIWGKDNIFKSFRMEKGDVDRPGRMPPGSSKGNTPPGRRSSYTSNPTE